LTAPLLTTKTHIPPVRAELVSRPRLIERLDEGLKCKLTLVSAPAGFGKTTLLSEWLHARRAASLPLTAAWLSLDEADNDPVRFLAYLVAALQAAQDGLWDEAVEDQQPSQPPPREETLARLINQVAAFPHQVALVLDDYHLITAQAVHDALAFLLEHLPDNMCLIIASRSDPPLQLPRLRARGHLLELRQAELRLTADEAAAFLNQVMGLGLAPEDVAALERRTEGWIAGLQMAALAVRGIAAQRTPSPQGIRGEMGPSGFVQAFTGSHRFVLDYLIEEVLDQQSPDIQKFLLQTSILERLTGPLCDAVRFGKAKAPSSSSESAVRFGEERAPDSHTGVGLPETVASQLILESLDSANLFIVALDDERRWYRYHRLFSDLLRKRLRQTHRDLVPVLHRRASEWHEEQGMMAAAIDHALAAEDFERAADLIEEHMEATLMRSEVATFMHWAERLPNEWMRTRPTLCFYHAWTLLMSGGSLDLVEQRLQDIACMQDVEDDAGDRVMPGRMAALRAYTTLFKADTGHTIELCREALESLPEGDQFLRGVVTWMLSLARVADGDIENGSLELTEVARRGQAIGNPMIAVTALCYQAKLQVRQGRPHRAREILERALRLATDERGQRLPIASEPLIGLGGLHREWNELETAADHLVEGIKLAKQWSELASFDAYIPLARTRQAQGDARGAREAMETARRIAIKSEVTEADDLVVDMQQAYFSLKEGDMEGALRWAERRGLLPGLAQEPLHESEAGQDFLRARLRKYEHLVLARLFIAQSRAAEAFDLLDPLLIKVRQMQRVDLIIEIQILRALAGQVAGRETVAMEALAEALSRTEAEGYMRSFLDEGQAMARLLRQAASRGIAPAYVARLLAAFVKLEGGEPDSVPHDRPAQPLVEPLSEREMDVLRLLASGMSNPEIAEELTVAVSTVRSHCKSIYGKLNVHKRWDAVHRAQELGLL
jgi:LuxR family maltose regulon positive regulatory protein